MAEIFAPDLLDTVTAAERLGVSPSFLAKARMQGRGLATASSDARSATRRRTLIIGSWHIAGHLPPNGRQSSDLLGKCQVKRERSSVDVYQFAPLENIFYAEILRL